MKNATRTLRNVKHPLTCAWPSSTRSVTTGTLDSCLRMIIKMVEANEMHWNPKSKISLRVFHLCPGSAKSIVKQCASQDTCRSASSSIDSNGDGNAVSCCNTHDLCNFSGAKSIHVHTLLLLSTAGALLLLSHWGWRHWQFVWLILPTDVIRFWTCVYCDVNLSLYARTYQG